MSKLALKRLGVWAVAVGVGVMLSGCPEIPDTGGGGGNSQAEYDAGFDAGFLEDAEYWTGFYDSYDTVDGGPIYYSGSSIPFLETPPYDAGYWDGVWYAYNDGYFVEYDYAFTIGFSEGYDLAFSPDWAVLLASDAHLEWLDGGFSDGYNDGFSEGRVFGAWDYANNWAYDWLNAMWDYRDGTDLSIGGVSTGLTGPVYLYEYGTDPLDLIKRDVPERPDRDGARPSIRRSGEKAEVPALSYRSLSAAAQQDFNVLPSTSPRMSGTLGLSTTWLQRIEAYLNLAKSGKAADGPSRAEFVTD